MPSRAHSLCLCLPLSLTLLPLLSFSRACTRAHTHTRTLTPFTHLHLSKLFCFVHFCFVFSVLAVVQSRQVQAHYVAAAGLELLPLPSMCWYYRHVPACPAYFVSLKAYGIEIDELNLLF